MIHADETIVLDTGNIIKCKQLTKQDFETLSDEVSASNQLS